MKDSMQRTTNGLLLLLSIGFVLLGCGKSEEATETLQPIAIEQGDECHVCGMIITNYPGPKGEAYLRHVEVPLKFCSTRDLFSYLLQPENEPNVTAIYVHDMGTTEWEKPEDTALVDARTAWYVIEQPMTGAMGPTLASFKQQSAANAFIDKHGGKLLRFEDITLEVLAKLGRGHRTH